jgi:hypothetical protein
MPTVQINGVIHQRQLSPRACWYTCLQMVVRYYENQAQASLAHLRSPDTFPDMQKRFADGSNPSWAEWRAWAERCGFTPLNLSPNADGIYQFLSVYGPIIYSGTWGNTFDGHVVVLTGINSDSGTLYVDDPLEVSAPVTKDINTYFARLTQTLWENPLFVYNQS